MSDYGYIDRNYAELTEEVARLADGREVDIIAAVKYAEQGELSHLLSLGVRNIGENRVPDLLAHYDTVRQYPDARVHFIGTLQRNKVKYIIDKVDLIHSLDGIPLAREIEKQAAKQGRCVDVLIEINIGREESKGGVAPEEAEELALSLADLPHIKLRGFMTMAPKCEKSSEYCEYFQKTFQLVLDIWTKKLHNIYERPIISMGMSESYREAIASGATCVRIGRGFFKK